LSCRGCDDKHCGRAMSFVMLICICDSVDKFGRKNIF